MSKKVIYHLHDDTSNCDGYFDSCTNFKDYIKLAKRDGDTAIAFSNHGGIYDWIKKKQECDKAGIKYIHGAEFYMCDKLEDNDRGYHIGLYSKNYEGVLELNTLLSKSKSKGVKDDLSDRHTYYNPRLSLDEIMNTSDNIIITTACIQSILFQYYKKANNMLLLQSGENIKISQDEKWRIKLNKVNSMSIEDKNIYENLKKKEKDAFLYKAKADYEALNKYYLDIRDKFINWIAENKHRCFLEIQAHNFEDQLLFNNMIKAWSKNLGIRMIAGTDSHSSTEYKAECRKIVQKSKDSYYDDEGSSALLWQTYDEMVLSFKEQGVFTLEEIEDAIHNTVVMADSVDSFELNYDFKYPTLYGDDANLLFKNRIEDMFKYKLDNGIIDSSLYDRYREKIDEEFETFTKQGMESFLLFMSELLEWCSKNGIPYGDRGSVTGSMIAYIINITDTDPIIWKTVFSRFCNVHRVSLGDIDCDFAPEDRVKVYKYIMDRFTREKTAFILTLGTLKDRSTIDVLSKGLSDGDNDLSLVKDIKNKFDKLNASYLKIIQSEVNLEELEGDEFEAKNVDFSHHDIYVNKIRNEDEIKNICSIKNEWDTLKSNNKDLFYYFDGIKGTIISKGRHAAGIIGSPITLTDHLGVHYKDGDESQPISSCSMKAVDSLNYVKFDILGLKTLGIIKDCYEYMGVKWKKSHEINWDNNKVWDNMIESNVGVFQFEGDFSFSLLKDFKPKTITHMSMINAALRPSGKSYRDRLISGDVNKNPSEQIDELLKDNNGYLIFQEDTIKFLTDICGFDGGTADIIRRSIGKKDTVTLHSYLPKIMEGYCSYSNKPREVAEKEVEQFLQIISDSSEYQFGYNHSTGYSMNGYRCIDIRTSDPIIFTTAYLNRAMNDEDILNGTKLARQYGFKIEPIKFRKSMSRYNYDEKELTIYKGTGSIKNIGKTNGDELHTLKDNKYSSFVDLLIDIDKNTAVNKSQVVELIKLDFFSEFGKAKKLCYIAESYQEWACKVTAKKAELPFSKELIIKYSKKETAKQYSGVDFISIIKECELLLEEEDYSMKEKIEFQLEYLGYVNTINSNLDKRYVLVTNLDTKYSPRFTAYCLNNGITQDVKVRRKPRRRQPNNTYFEDTQFEEGDILYVSEFERKMGNKMVDGEWQKTGKFDFWCKNYRKTKEGEI